MTNSVLFRRAVSSGGFPGSSLLRTHSPYVFLICAAKRDLLSPSILAAPTPQNFPPQDFHIFSKIRSCRKHYTGIGTSFRALNRLLAARSLPASFSASLWQIESALYNKLSQGPSVAQSIPAFLPSPPHTQPKPLDTASFLNKDGFSIVQYGSPPCSHRVPSLK